MGNEPTARIELAPDGSLVLVDPDAAAMIGAVACENFYRANEERMWHFARRIVERGMSPDDVLIVCLDVDDPNGGRLADLLMPGHDWQAYRDRGECPVARGLAQRAPLLELADRLTPGVGAANPLRAGCAQVLVVAGGGASLRSVVLPSAAGAP